MSRFERTFKHGYVAPGMDHQYRSDMVIFYTNGRLACGLRVPALREVLVKRKKVRRAKVYPNFRPISDMLPF